MFIRVTMAAILYGSVALSFIDLRSYILQQPAGLRAPNRSSTNISELENKNSDDLKADVTTRRSKQRDQYTALWKKQHDLWRNYITATKLLRWGVVIFVSFFSKKILMKAKIHT